MRLTIAMKVPARLLVAAVCCAIVLMPTVAGVRIHAQAFDSGSDGSDGALDLAPNLGTILFEPGDTARWGRVLDADGDGVYHFTTITIGAGTTLKVTADQVVRPLYWLASGNITIAGAIDISGANGLNSTNPLIRRQLAVPGPGGFAGGAGGLVGATVPPSAGDGPGGGAAATLTCNGPSQPQRCGAGGSFTGNRYLIPLQGGSGGGGGLWTDGNYYMGGAGGGAILLASSTTIAVTGAVLARGGAGSSTGGGGSGGAIRLVAPTMSGTGPLDVRGGAGSFTINSSGAAGMVRLERFSQTGTFNLSAGGQFITVGSPIDAGTLRPQGLVRVTAVGGVAVPSTAAGSFVLPDVTISSAAPVPVEIEASGVPPGTIVTLTVYPQTPDDDAVITLPPVQATLQGTAQHSTATINFTFPYGFSRGTLRATW